MKIKPLPKAKRHYPKGVLRIDKTYSTYREMSFPNISLFKGEDGNPYRYREELFEVVK